MSFGSQVESFVQKAKNGIDVEFGKQILAFYRDVVIGTPVDEGTLQNNWRIGVSLEAGIDPPVKSSSSVIMKGAAKITSLSKTDSVWVYNNVVYAEVVENGLEGTRRTPARMMKKAIMAARARGTKK